MLRKLKFASGVKHPLTGLIVASLIFCLATSGALAQEISDDGDGFVLEEIMVTAQRRAESLQTTAIAATAIQGEALFDKGVVNITDLQFASPGLTILDGTLTKAVSIRGIGLASISPAVTNGVATYVDGVFQPPIVGTGSFFDIQNVEVLRGPQGTFVGSNSTGGAIFINSKSPTLDGVGGYAQAEMGDYNALGFQGAINVPMGDIFAVRVAANYQKHDSYYTDIGPYHNEPGRLDETSGRIGARLQTDRFEALLKISETEIETGGHAVQPRGTLLSGKDIYTVEYNSPTKNDEKGHQSTLELNVTLPGDIVLRSMSGYQNKRSWNDYDLDGSAARMDVNNQFVGEKVYTQEINLISPTDGAINWVAGVYYQKNEVDVEIGSPPAQDIVIMDDKQTRGMFGQIAFKLTPALEMDAGIRYSDYEVEQEGSVTLRPGMAFPGAPAIKVADLAGDYSDSMPTGKVGLNWTVNPDNLLYGFVARGYKAGGFNSAEFQFEPETVWDYEAGWKSTLMNGHLRIQTGVFWMEYENFQIDVLNPADGRNGPDNVSDGTVKGFEFNAQGQFNAAGFDMGYSFVDSELGEVEFINAELLPPGRTNPSCELGGIPGVSCTDYSNAWSRSSGEQMLLSPEHTFNAGVDYTFNLSNGMTLRPRINFSYIGEQWTYMTYDPATVKLAARRLWSAQITLNQRWGNKYDWSVEAFCNNLADEEYVVGGRAANRTETYGRPRVLGVRALFNF